LVLRGDRRGPHAENNNACVGCTQHSADHRGSRWSGEQGRRHLQIEAMGGSWRSPASSWSLSPAQDAGA